MCHLCVQYVIQENWLAPSIDGTAVVAFCSGGTACLVPVSLQSTKWNKHSTGFTGCLPLKLLNLPLTMNPDGKHPNSNRCNICIRITHYCAYGLLLIFLTTMPYVLKENWLFTPISHKSLQHSQFRIYSSGITDEQLHNPEQKDRPAESIASQMRVAKLNEDQRNIRDFMAHRLGYQSFPDQCRGPVNYINRIRKYQNDWREFDPYPFLRTYRNPCWLQPGSLLFRCLPYFYLAGFPKCGTSDLYSRIALHPDVAWATKEPHWIARIRFKGLRKDSSLNYYTEMYAQFLNCSHCTRLSVVGDGSASTVWDNRRWHRIPDNRCCREPRVINADLIRQLNPDAKIIMMLRNPTLRLYSDYMYFLEERKSKEKFHKLTMTAIAIFNSCLKRGSVWMCAYKKWSGYSQLRLHVGLYSVFIEDWLLRFPRDQILLLRSEDIFHNVSGTMQNVFKFLHIAPPNNYSQNEMLTMKTKNVGSRSMEKGVMLEKTRKALDKFYRPFNERLATILEDERFTWKDT